MLHVVHGLGVHPQRSHPTLPLLACGHVHPLTHASAQSHSVIFKWAAVIAINLTAPFAAAKIVLPTMYKKGWGELAANTSLCAPARALNVDARRELNESPTHTRTHTPATHVRAAHSHLVGTRQGRVTPQVGVRRCEARVGWSVQSDCRGSGCSRRKCHLELHLSRMGAPPTSLTASLHRPFS
jgi:hypothetical protein